MFKFKMSLLLKSAKFKVAVIVLAIAAVIAGIICIPKNKARDISQTAAVRGMPTGVTVAGHAINVTECYPMVAGYEKIFCIEQEAMLSYKQYTNPIDIANAQSYFTNYNSATWLLNNMYISNVTGTNGKTLLLTNLGNLLTSESVKANVKTKYGYDGTNVTTQKIVGLQDKNIGGQQFNRNAIEAVEQIALWKYTKNTATSVSDAYNNPNNLFQNTSLTADEQTTLKYMYYALLTIADSKAGVATPKTINNFVTLNKNSAKFNEENYLVGPYYLESNGVKLASSNLGGNYPITITVTTNDGNSVELGKVDSNGETITSSEATFDINGKEQTTAKGVLAVVTKKTVENVEQKDTYTIKETVAPKGYNAYEGTISLNVQFKQEGKKFIIDDSKTTCTAPGQTGKIFNVSTDNTKITIYVKNTKEVKIHKGVKSVENQNSGYMYEDLKTGKKYTEEQLNKVMHRWVIETTIEDQIEKYKKYIITDKVDTTKLDFAGLDRVVVTLVDKNGSEKALTINKDYKLEYKDDVLKVSFIENDFMSETIKNAEIGSLQGYKFRVVFNTTFKVVDGKLAVLKDAVTTDSYGMIVKKGNTKLLNVTNRVIKRLKKEGKIDKYLLNHKEIKKDNSKKSITSSFYKSVIYDGRYKYILEGLKNTLIIALGAVIIGIILGTLLSVIRNFHDNTGNLKFLNLFSKIYITVIRGTPSILQLMIIYYVIFKQTFVNIVIVGILAFGINSAAYVAEIIRAGLNSVDRGQLEAGYSLGLSYRQIISHIIFPQAIKNILPALGNEFITLVKETSVGAYIGIVELTKASDIIASRTYDYFFPLILIAIIYLLITFILSKVFSMLERKMNNA